MAVPNKARVHVSAGIETACRHLRFPPLGIDLDNGSEFINDQPLGYCLQEQITFTHGRPRKNNDSAYDEQKNWSVVRRTVGYHRYDTSEQLALLNRLYALLHWYPSFFLPVTKLKDKVQVGSRKKRIYDDLATPYAGLWSVLMSPTRTRRSSERHTVP